MKILYYPTPVLTKPAVEVDEIDDQLIHVCQDMLQAMYEVKGLGLAGPQVGLSRRVIVINPTNDPNGEVQVVNPVIVQREGIAEAEEGCLSFPGLFTKITRSARVLVKAYDLQGRERQFEAEGLAARLWQHEIDHLDGVLMITRMTPVRRLAAMRLLKGLEREFRRKEEK